MSPKPVAPSERLRDFWDQARRRPLRLRPSHLPAPLRILAIVTWISAAVTLVFGFTTTLFVPQQHELSDGRTVLPFSYQPLWPLMCGIALGSGVAATGFVIMATRRDAPRHHAVMALCSGVAVPLIPVLLLARNRVWQAIPATAAWLAAAAIIVIALYVRRRAPSPWLGLLLALLVALPWLPVIYFNLRIALAVSGRVPLPPNDLLELLAGNIVAKAFVVSAAISFVAVMTAAGVALAAHSRSSVADRLRRGDASWRVAAIICAIAVALIVAEVSGVAGISSGFYEGYWGLRSLGTWPHAVLVAALIAFVAQRSHRFPLRQRGDIATTLLVGVIAVAGDIVLAGAAVSSLVTGAVTTSFRVYQPAEHLSFVVTWLALAAMVPIAVRPAMRDTIGQWVARVTLLYLVPVFAPITLMQLGGIDVPITFWATPAQVAIVLTVIACVATLVGLTGRRTFLAPGVASRLAIVPLLIVAGTSWLPTFITKPLTAVIAVAAALFTLLWAMPPVAADKMRHSGVVLTVSAQLLLVGAAAAIVTAIAASDFGPSDLSFDDPTYALLVFGVPLTALVCARVTSSDVTDEARPAAQRV